MSPGVRLETRPLSTTPKCSLGSRRRAVVRATRAAAPRDDKVIHFMRHGTTEMNVYLHENLKPGQSIDEFEDPLFFDTRLTPEGRALAASRARATVDLTPEPEVLLVSPLTRAIDTMELAFPHVECPREVAPLARERLYLSSDVGRAPAQLAAEYPHLDFGALDDIWWSSDGSGDPTAVVRETTPEFLERMEELVDALYERPEATIGVVCHWCVLFALTGKSFENCQIMSMNLSEVNVAWREDVVA